MEIQNNTIELVGEAVGVPRPSHSGYGEDFFVFPFSVKRLSMTPDTVNVIIRSGDAQMISASQGKRMRITGEVRSFNNKSGVGSRLVISVYAKSFELCDDAYRNEVHLYGTVCKKPTLRTTPMGREICDVMLAVNRKYARSDYLPCIVWGAMAHDADALCVGDRVAASGRLQQRNYVKITDGGAVNKTAYEISVSGFRKE